MRWEVPVGATLAIRIPIIVAYHSRGKISATLLAPQIRQIDLSNVMRPLAL